MTASRPLPRAVVAAVCGAAAVLSAGNAFAQNPRPVGAAEAVEHRATKNFAGRSGPLHPGDDVMRRMAVATAAASSARLRFVDATKLTIGPSSRVVIDRFVFSGDRSVRRLGVNLLRGGFRFVSGASDHRAYDIRTPHAVIGVRGTTIGFIVTARSTTVILKQGAATVCRRGTRTCRTLTVADQAVVLTARSVSRPAVRRPGDPDFADWCRGGGAACGL